MELTGKNNDKRKRKEQFTHNKFGLFVGIGTDFYWKIAQTNFQIKLNEQLFLESLKSTVQDVSKTSTTTTENRKSNKSFFL